MSGIKRKSPYGSMSASPAPHSRGASAPIKTEPDTKRWKMSIPTFTDPRTVVIDLRDNLKSEMTRRYEDLYDYIEDRYPGVDATTVLDLLKKQERVSFNETNRVYTYEPEVVLKNQSDVRSYIRTHSQPTRGIPYKELREAMPGDELKEYLNALESDKSVLVLRGLTGRWKDAGMPPLGRPTAWGERVDSGDRWKMVFWDELRERGRAAERLDDEFIIEWADVKIAPTDDVAKLLEGQDLKASTAAVQEKKKDGDGNNNKPAKKKRRGRALKLTNTHMKALGIDFSKDYEGE